MNINKISIKNFRVFKEKTTFQLRPFTILTGPNNSGKSSIIKLLLLLKNNSENLFFEEGNHNLESYEKSLNRDSKSKKLEIDFQVYDYDHSNSYNENGILERIKCESENKLLLDFFYRKEKQPINDDPMDQLLSDSPDYHTKQILTISLNELKENALKMFNFGGNKNDSYAQEFIKFKDGLIYKITFDNEDLTHKFKEDILEFQKELLNNRNLANIWLDVHYESYNDVYQLLEKKMKFFVENNRKDFSNRLRRKHKTKELEVEYSKLGDFLFKKEHLFEYYDNYSNYYEIRFLHELKKILQTSKISEQLKNLFYVSANRGSQKRILKNKSDNDIDEIVSIFSKRKFIDEIFINECFRILEIEGEFIVERFENRISAVYVKNGENKTALADLGYGYSQLIPIILIIHNSLPDEEKKEEYHMNYRTIILEEPESNLHPNLQSKLAEVLAYASKKCKIKYIIETHSEYFIRKLQFLTAKKDLKIKDSVIYYFNDDKYVSKREPKVKEIFINEDGGLTDSFGPGFFDEATKLQFDLIKLNKQQMN